MNTPALIGMMIGASMAVYIFRPLFKFLLKKIITAKSERIEKNIATLFSSLFCTMIYYIVSNMLSWQYVIGGLIIILLGFLPRKKKEEI